jgi:hypothetical protein
MKVFTVTQQLAPGNIESDAKKNTNNFFSLMWQLLIFDMYDKIALTIQDTARKNIDEPYATARDFWRCDLETV